MDIVIAALHADAGLHFESGETPIERMSRIDAAERATVELAELVAIDGIVEKVGEIVEQPQVGAHDIGADIGLSVVARLRPVARQAESAGGAAVGRIERAEAVDQALVDRALSDLVGRIP